MRLRPAPSGTSEPQVALLTSHHRGEQRKAVSMKEKSRSKERLRGIWVEGYFSDAVLPPTPASDLEPRSDPFFTLFGIPSLLPWFYSCLLQSVCPEDPEAKGSWGKRSSCKGSGDLGGVLSHNDMVTSDFPFLDSS